MGLVLPESGRLVACERDLKSLEVARRYYKLAGISHKVIICSLDKEELTCEHSSLKNKVTPSYFYDSRLT